MARELTSFGKIVLGAVKWLIIPVIAALIGYWVIAPMIASSKEPRGEAKGRTTPLSDKGKKFQSVREPEH